MRLLASMVLLAGVALAADASGKWSGTFTPEGGDSSGAYLVLKQKGMEITGTAGPDEGTQWTIGKGRVENNTVTIEVTSPDGPVYKCSMTLDGDSLKGDVIVSAAGGNTRPAKIELKRVQ